MRTQAAVVVLACCVLAACGGGGGGLSEEEADDVVVDVVEAVAEEGDLDDGGGGVDLGDVADDMLECAADAAGDELAADTSVLADADDNQVAVAAVVFEGGADDVVAAVLADDAASCIEDVVTDSLDQFGAEAEVDATVSEGDDDLGDAAAEVDIVATVAGIDVDLQALMAASGQVLVAVATTGDADLDDLVAAGIDAAGS